jgi:hypothetical protein
VVAPSAKGAAHIHISLMMGPRVLMGSPMPGLSRETFHATPQVLDAASKPKPVNVFQSFSQ